MEVMVILVGMKKSAEHQRLLLEYSGKNKITFYEALKFALVEETAERQAMKGKSSSSINSIKQGEKANPKNPKPAAAAKEPEKKMWKMSILLPQDRRLYIHLLYLL